MVGTEKKSGLRISKYCIFDNELPSLNGPTGFNVFTSYQR